MPDTNICVFKYFTPFFYTLNIFLFTFYVLYPIFLYTYVYISYIYTVNFNTL